MTQNRSASVYRHATLWDFRTLIAALALVSACGRNTDVMPRPNAEPENPITIVAFGDSLTAGKDLLDPDHDAYPAVLEARLKKNGFPVRVVNSGSSGNTTFDALDRLDFSIDTGVDIVLLCFGANDSFQGKKLRDIETNLREIIRRCRGKGAAVLLFEMKTLPNLGPYYGTDFEKMYHRLADEEEATLVPFLLEGVAGNPSLNLDDMIHPNAAGYQKVVDTIYPAVEEAVKLRR